MSGIIDLTMKHYQCQGGVYLAGYSDLDADGQLWLVWDISPLFSKSGD